MQKQEFTIYKIFKISICILVAVVFAVYISDVKAQMFDEADFNKGTNDTEITSNTTKNEPKSKNLLPIKRGIKYKYAADNKKETAEKVTVKEVQEVSPIDPNEKIYMYIRDFKISHNINGTISCNMRFYIYSKVKEKINNVSYRLKWPKIETPFSFSNVTPETPVYKEYTLLGDGCYDLDAAPNIIVNRCRIKGRTQQHCASIIQWTK